MKIEIEMRYGFTKENYEAMKRGLDMAMETHFKFNNSFPNPDPDGLDFLINRCEDGNMVLESKNDKNNCLTISKTHILK